MPLSSTSRSGGTSAIGMLLVALLSFVFCANGNAGSKPLPDVVVDDTNVYPESMSAARDGTIYIGSMKGIVFRATPGSPKAEALDPAHAGERLAVAPRSVGR